MNDRKPSATSPNGSVDVLTRRSMLFGTAAAFGAAATPAFGASTKPVTLLSPSPNVLPYHGFLFLGTPLGFYQDCGVSVDFEPIDGSTSVLQMVGAGDADMGYLGSAALLNAKVHHPDLPAIAVFLQDIHADYAVGVPASGAVHGPADLKGRRIGVLSLSSGAVPWLSAYLSKTAGLEEDDYDVVAVGAGGPAAAIMRSGRIDALCMSHGIFVSIASLGLDLRFFTHEEASGVIIANTDFLARERQRAVGVLQGIVLSQTFMEINPRATVAAYNAKFGGDQQNAAVALDYVTQVASMWKSYRDTSRPWGQMSDASWTGLVQFDALGTAAKHDGEKALLAALYTNELIADVNRVDLGIALRAAARGP